MKIWWFTALIAIFMFNVVYAESGLEIEEISKGNIVIAEVGGPVYYDLVINNSLGEDKFKIFTLVGVQIQPSEYLSIGTGQTVVPIQATMSEKILIERRGPVYIEYQVKGINRDLLLDKFLVKIVTLEDILDFSFGDFSPDSNRVEVVVTNTENVQLNDLDLVFDSVFFRESFKLSLLPFENKTFSIPVYRAGTESLVAGPYIVVSTVVAAEKEIKYGGIINFLEKEGLSVSEEVDGLIVRTNTIKKLNKGNTPVVASVSMRKDVFSRLFTSHSPSSPSVSRDGFFVDYTWEKKLNPNEEFVVFMTTNYTLPFFILVLVVILGAAVRIYYLGSVSINKRVSLIRTKGGEFALRVVLRVKARKSVDKLQLNDSLPGMTKLYENYGKHPDMVEQKSRCLSWNIGHLRRGEQRVYSYVIYSKLNIVGKFELPLAHARFERDGKMRDAFSNRAYLAMEKS